MRRYKNEIFIGLFILVLNGIIFLWANDYASAVGSAYVMILKQTPYILVFSGLLFALLYDSYDCFLELYRANTNTQYVCFKIRNAMISYGIVFGILTIGQAVLFGLFDSNFNFVTLLYRNILFYLLILFMKYFVLTRKKKQQLLTICILYIIWCFLILTAIQTNISFINTWNVFSLLKEINLVGILRHFIIITIIVLLIHYQTRQERYKAQWLE